MKKINELLSNYFCDLHKIDYDSKYTIEFVDARDLLVSSRLDLLPKIKWIESYETGIAPKYADDYYKAHIEAITGRRFKEGGQEDTKDSYEAFVETFKDLTSIKTKGFDPEISVVPVDKDGVIMDGAHRTAVGIYYGMKIPIIRLEKEYPHADVYFFRKYLLDEFYIEQMVTDYCRMTSRNVYAICLWPRAKDENGNREKAEKLIRQKCNIFYRKEVSLSSKALRYFVLQIYRDFGWVGTPDNYYEGASLKSNLCWANNSSTIFYFVEGPELTEIRKLKEDIRDVFKVDLDSVHITDNNKETLFVANLILNPNSLDLINNGCPDKSKKLNSLMEVFREEVIQEKKNLNDFVIDSSAVMGLYGLREVGDLDYACIGDGIIDNMM